MIAPAVLVGDGGSGEVVVMVQVVVMKVVVMVLWGR